MQIVLAADHAGFDLKEKVKASLSKQGREIIDCGTNSPDSSDYPDFAKLAAARISSGSVPFGVFICGSGIGMCMAANRFKGVRAAVLRDENDAVMSRRHNDANVACLGSRVTKEDDAMKLIDTFLATPFEGGRHEQRVKKMD